MTPIGTKTKDLIRPALRVLGVGRAVRLLRRRQAIILAYHNVVPDGMAPVGEHSLHLPFSSFVNQMEAVARTHKVVPLADVLGWDAVQSGGPCVAITFDDAYAGAIELAGDVLHRMGLPATMFVAPGELGGKAFWWDRYANPELGWLPEAFRNAVLEMGVADEARVEALAERFGIQSQVLPEPALTASAEAVRSYGQTNGMTLAPHTWSHPNLAALTHESARDQIARSWEWLQQNTASPGPWISYPFGMYTDHTIAAAQQVGLSAGFALTGDWISQRPLQPFRISRVNVHSMVDLTGFRLRIDGLARGTGA